MAALDECVGRQLFAITMMGDFVRDRSVSGLKFVGFLLGLAKQQLCYKDQRLLHKRLGIRSFEDSGVDDHIGPIDSVGKAQCKFVINVSFAYFG